MRIKINIFISIFILCITSCKTDEILKINKTTSTTNSEKLELIKAKQRVALIAVTLNIVEKEGIAGNEKKIENLLSLSYKDTVYHTISDSIINCILKINLKNKFEYSDAETSELHLNLYREYAKKLLGEKKFSDNCLALLTDFQHNKTTDRLKIGQKVIRKKNNTVVYKVKANMMGSDKVMEFLCPSDMYLLDAAEENGYEWPCSSRAGASYDELAELIQGTVDNSDQSLLSDDEIAMGFILTDTSYPTSDIVIRLIPDVETYGTVTDVYLYNRYPTVIIVNTGEIQGGGYVTEPAPKVLIRTDCNDTIAQHATKISSILNSFYNDGSPGFNMLSVNTAISSLRNVASSAYEYGSSIIYGDNKYFASPFMKGSSIAVSTNLSTNSFKLEYSTRTIMVAHTHPKGGLSSPSPSDANFLCIAYIKEAKNIYCNTIIAADSSEYAVYVSDKTAFTKFCNDTRNASFFERSGSLFKTGSVYDKDYNTVFNNLVSKKYSQTIANSYALSYVLDKYKTGIKIACRNKKTEDFKEQKTNLVKSDYQPSKCQ